MQTAAGVRSVPVEADAPREPAHGGSRRDPAGRGALIAGPALAGGFAVVLLAFTWSWWALKHGAYFGSVLYPGIALLCAGFIALAVAARWRVSVRPGSPLAIAFLALFGLGIWSLVSAVWSPTPDVAVGDGQRILAYALAFALGGGLVRLLSPRITFAMAPLAIAGAVAGIVTAVSLAGTETVRDYLLPDGTLDFPLGYRNANAAFFAIAMWPALGLAQARALDWRLRGPALGVATLCLELALLSQSRAGVLGGAAAFAIYLAAAPNRIRALAWLACAVVPATIVLPALTDLYRVANDGGLGEAVGELHTAGISALVGMLVAAAIGLIAAGLDSDRRPSAARVAHGNRVVAVLAAGLLAAGGLAFVATAGDPIDWIEQRVDEFRSPQGTPDLSEGSTRFTVNAGSERYDAWRVALADAGENPLLGDGAGGYQYSYDRERQVPYQNLHDAHSVELEILSELGVPGLAMFVVAIGAAGIGAVRARRAGPEAAALSAIALTAGTYWLVHASFDWFWPYAAITAPVLALLGSACAAGTGRSADVGSAQAGGPRRWPVVVAVIAAIVLGLSVIPPYLSDRYTESAVSDWRSDLDRAYDDLDAARSLNPLSIAPLMVEGAIADAAGEPHRTIGAYTEATEERPENWASHYLLAKAYLPRSPHKAAEAARRANELNPLNSRVDTLLRELRQRR
jgi:O-Antigen ligase